MSALKGAMASLGRGSLVVQQLYAIGVLDYANCSGFRIVCWDGAWVAGLQPAGEF